LRLDRDIIKYARDEFGLVLGEMVTEDIKNKIGSAMPLKEEIQMEMRGRDVVSGLPKEVTVNSSQIRDAIGKSIKSIVDIIKATLESTPPELAADIYQKGIIMTGGTSQLRELDKYISAAVQIPVHIADDPQTCTVRGMGVILDDKNLLVDIAVSPAQ